MSHFVKRNLNFSINLSHFTRISRGKKKIFFHFHAVICFFSTLTPINNRISYLNHYFEYLLVLIAAKHKSKEVCSNNFKDHCKFLIKKTRKKIIKRWNIKTYIHLIIHNCSKTHNTQSNIIRSFTNLIFFYFSM